MSAPQEQAGPSPTRHIATWGLIGFVAPILPLWLFFEARVEKRVRQEVKVQALEARLEAQTELMQKFDGRIWTMEQKLDSFLLNQATQSTPQSE